MDPKWRVIYFIGSSGENPVSDFLDTLTMQQQGKILRVFRYIEEYGLQSVIPHLKKLSGTLFWEIRILGKDKIRVIYIVPARLTVLVLHGFIKKKQKTPVKELETATRRYKQWQKRVDN